MNKLHVLRKKPSVTSRFHRYGNLSAAPLSREVVLNPNAIICLASEKNYPKVDEFAPIEGEIFPKNRWEKLPQNRSRIIYTFSSVISAKIEIRF
jgi:hypothetical protein